MKIVFLGTPSIARDCLEALYNSHHEILAVVTKPDKKVGRGQAVTFSPVKEFALQKGLKVLQFNSVSKEGVEVLKALKADAFVLVAFGQILKREILDLALPLNLHGSLLPKYRGPSPIQTAILNGEKVTGLSVMKMEDGVDTGDVLLTEQVDIAENDTSKTLFDKMGKVGGPLLIKVLDLIESGKYTFSKQNDKNATYTKIFTKESAKLSFDDTAQNIVNKIRAYNDNPVAYFMLGEEKFKVFSAREIFINEDIKETGQIVYADNKRGLIISAKDSFVEILEMQAPNSKVMLAKNYLNGHKLNVVGKVE